MILVLAGTLEGRKTAALLQTAGFKVLASTVTDYGSQLLLEQGVQQARTGALDRASLKELLGQGVELLVDATHPFAAEVSMTSIGAAQEVGIPYVRLERPQTNLPVHPLVYACDDLNSSIKKALSLGRVIFSTLGSKNLPMLIAAAKETGVKVVARILPEPAVVANCLNLGLTPRDMIALQGPCSQELNMALYKQYQSEVIITKDSGNTGGVQEKIGAALELGIPIVIWQRPRLHYPLVLHSPAEVLQYCQSFKAS
ncbi:precorrin-6A reductase [Desulfotomaculum defluvii]